MKRFYEFLQSLRKEPPQFKFKYLMFKCPGFIVKAILDKPEAETRETRHWWDNYPEVYTRQSENAIEYQPKYLQL
ncbi:MAG: hypothetical protein FD181_1861 [Prolixibacteraceae bacterium]|nr:MAG: hypothetical protein FD181_1861 [Prolixibacteraceae bacterium]